MKKKATTAAGGKRRPRQRPKQKPASNAGKSRDEPLENVKPTKLRIIGGDMRNRHVAYHGNRITRPMKDSVRENLFNILGRACRGAIAFDLFAGTGVLAFEAISRGAIRATVVETNRRAMIEMRKTTERLDLESKLSMISGDAFGLFDQILRPHPSEPADTAWIVFLSPPYSMWTDEETYPKLAAVIEHVKRWAPPGSVLAVETDDTFDCENLPEGDWDIRRYGITQLAFLEPANVCGLNL